ncbi:MAG: hypothetical protein COC05_00055 [Gammaproteobacteria bacterium]|nr:MAG: hypothetical protein COC05_00055 [Gammaproteobacteria bacterium]
MEGMDREALNDLLSSIIDRGTLAPVSHEAEASYRLQLTCGIRWRPQGVTIDGLFLLNTREIQQK